MRTWADDAGIVPASTAVDRDAGEGPVPRCCARSTVAADALVYYGALDADRLAMVITRLPSLAGAASVYVCDACRETLRRERIIARTEMPLFRALRRPDVL